MGRIHKLAVRNFKSIKDQVELYFPSGVPTVLVGANNSGKSNLMRALELVVGESWPGSYKPEDHDFHDRNQENIPLEIIVGVADVSHTDRYRTRRVSQLLLTHPPDDDHVFFMIFEDGSNSPYVSNETREQCRSVLISADRRLSYQLGYSSKYTFLSKLMREFYQALKEDPDRMTALKGRFDEVKELFQGVAQFKTFTEELQKQVAEFSGNLEYRLGVDFSAYDPSNYFHALRVLPHQDDQVRTFDELGTGQEQMLGLSFAYAYAKAFHGESEGLVLIIEEPEAHLHPLAQEWVGRKIRELAEEGVQVVVTTHSPAFLNVLGLEGVALVRKDANATRVTQLSRGDLATYCQARGARAATPDSVLHFYAAAATEELLSGFFANKVVLVEGPTEALALPVYLERVGLNPVKNGVAVLSVHGVGNLAKWWRLFTAYGIPVYATFDNDADDDARAEKRADILGALGVPNERHPDLMNATGWITDPRFTVFGRNFEEIMRATFGGNYNTLEEEARVRFGLSGRESKPLVARYVAMRIAVEEGTPPWERFRSLAGAIEAIAPVDR